VTGDWLSGSLRIPLSHVPPHHVHQAAHSESIEHLSIGRDVLERGRRGGWVFGKGHGLGSTQIETIEPVLRFRPRLSRHEGGNNSLSPETLPRALPPSPGAAAAGTIPCSHLAHNRAFSNRAFLYSGQSELCRQPSFELRMQPTWVGSHRYVPSTRLALDDGDQARSVRQRPWEAGHAG
jgi:hypothetical protein